MGMDQYLLIPFLVGWTSIYQLFWCSPGVQGFDTLPYADSGMSFGSRWALIVIDTAINWWIMPPIFLVVAPNFADETNSQFPLGVDWCAHHQDSEHASQTEDRSWILELNLSPPNRWAKMPLHFLGTLIDWGVCVFFNCLRVFSFGRNKQIDRLWTCFCWWFLVPTLQWFRSVWVATRSHCSRLTFTPCMRATG